jgi:hypothetical protein
MSFCESVFLTHSTWLVSSPHAGIHDYDRRHSFADAFTSGLFCQNYCTSLCSAPIILLIRFILFAIVVVDLLFMIIRTSFPPCHHHHDHHHCGGGDSSEEKERPLQTLARLLEFRSLKLPQKTLSLSNTALEFSIISFMVSFGSSDDEQQ